MEKTANPNIWHLGPMNEVKHYIWYLGPLESVHRVSKVGIRATPQMKSFLKDFPGNNFQSMIEKSCQNVAKNVAVL